MRFCVLASGSRGNAVWVEDHDSAVLIDAGLSGRELERRMAAVSLSRRKLKAILVSHEHRDHISGVGILARRFNLPVFINEPTLSACEKSLGRIKPAFFTTGQDFELGPFQIHPFSVSHDAADPVGFTFGTNQSKLGLATDLGIATTLVRTHLSGCHAVILESNHDPEMLMNGPYPHELKRRVSSRHGHLSNVDAAALLDLLIHDGLARIVLAHLSETNNRPDLALNHIGSNVPRLHPGCRLAVAFQDRPSDVFEI